MNRQMRAQLSRVASAASDDAEDTTAGAGTSEARLSHSSFGSIDTPKLYAGRNSMEGFPAEELDISAPLPGTEREEELERMLALSKLELAEAKCERDELLFKLEHLEGAAYAHSPGGELVGTSGAKGYKDKLTSWLKKS